MERLTKRIDGAATYRECYGTCGTCDGTTCFDIGPMVYRLAAYEDAMPLERAHELAQAEKDGRLVVLPAKPDETVYQWKKGDDIPSMFRLDGVSINGGGDITYQTHWGETFTPDDFGKTVFLTREEAEAALKKREADNETVR